MSTPAALRGGRWVREGLTLVWRAWKEDRPECGIADCTAVHVPWSGMDELLREGA